APMNCLRLRVIRAVYRSHHQTRVKKSLIRFHRYLAIALSVPFLVWFASGIAMIYTGGMPRLTRSARLQRLRAVDLQQVRITPFEAGKRAGPHGELERVVLLTIMGRPAYRLTGLDTVTVFADTGDLLGPIDSTAGLAIAAAFLQVPIQQLRYVRELREPDQWTIGLSRELPLQEIQ